MQAKPSNNGHHSNDTHQANGPAPPSLPNGKAAPPVVPPPAPSETGANGQAKTPDREDSGRFAPGNKCAKGNPFSRKLGAMRSAFLNAVAESDVADLARALLKEAQGGNMDAARLFLNYAVGKPTAAVDVDNLDLEEIRLLGKRPDEETYVPFLFFPKDVDQIRERALLKARFAFEDKMREMGLSKKELKELGIEDDDEDEEDEEEDDPAPPKKAKAKRRTKPKAKAN